MPSLTSRPNLRASPANRMVPRTSPRRTLAGITDLRNYVLDGSIEGHCDCMFMVNTERWDFDRVASLVAPRPLMILNTDKDPLFSLDPELDASLVEDPLAELFDFLPSARLSVR